MFKSTTSRKMHGLKLPPFRGRPSSDSRVGFPVTRSWLSMAHRKVRKPVRATSPASRVGRGKLIVRIRTRLSGANYRHILERHYLELQAGVRTTTIKYIFPAARQPNTT